MLEEISYYQIKFHSSLNDKGCESSEIKQLIYDLKKQQYVFSIVPEKIVQMNNGIEYYYVEAGYNDSKVIINAYGTHAEELFKEVHKDSLLKNNLSQ